MKSFFNKSFTSQKDVCCKVLQALQECIILQLHRGSRCKYNQNEICYYWCNDYNSNNCCFEHQGTHPIKPRKNTLNMSVRC